MASDIGKMLRAALLLLLVGILPVRAPAQTDSGQFLLISDIHFDPFFDGALFQRLVAEPAEGWGAILHGAGPAGINPRGTDSNDALLQSSFDDALGRCPQPAFILFPGDFMAHRWQAKYDKLATRSHFEDPASYRGFTSKAIRYLAEEFRRRYPRTPILPTLGNDDSFCGDYMIEPEGPFLEMFAGIWEPLLGPELDRGAFRETFPRGGYYTSPLSGLKAHRLVVLNSVFFSVNYDNACGPSTKTPALDQLRWLDRTLDKAQTAGESVWLLMHVPPGINSFNSAEGVSRGGPPVTFWQPELTSRFVQLIRRYRATIRAVFAGHTHMDDFRVIRLDSEPALLCKIAPAISPIFGNNPGYQVYQYDRGTGILRDYQTYNLTNLADSGSAAAPAIGRWALEYDFREAYGYPELSARNGGPAVGGHGDRCHRAGALHEILRHGRGPRVHRADVCHLPLRHREYQARRVLDVLERGSDAEDAPAPSRSPTIAAAGRAPVAGDNALRVGHSGLDGRAGGQEAVCIRTDMNLIASRTSD